jgi:hypothetical protein
MALHLSKLVSHEVYERERRNEALFKCASFLKYQEINPMATPLFIVEGN